MGLVTQRLFAAAFSAAVVILGLSPGAHASSISLGQAAKFAVYGFHDLFSPGPLTVNGNVGVAPGGDANLGGNGVVITGQLMYSDPITVSNFAPQGSLKATINGSAFNNSGTTDLKITNGITAGQLVQSSAIALKAKTDLVALYNTAKALTTATPGAPSGALNSSFSWTGNGGTNVAELTSLSLSSGRTLTFTGTASDEFILNISGDWAMSGSGAIVLNGVSSDHVLFNLLESADGGSGEDIGASGSSVGYGILLALDRNITFDTPGGSWNGRLFSDTNKTVKLFSHPMINQPVTPPPVVPIPAALWSGSGLLAGLGALRTAGAKRGKKVPQPWVRLLKPVTSV